MNIAGLFEHPVYYKYTQLAWLCTQHRHTGFPIDGGSYRVCFSNESGTLRPIWQKELLNAVDLRYKYKCVIESWKGNQRYHQSIWKETKT